ncbi:putative non-repetitive nucleoporin [Patellaria atrata CBS 101060]|uniref:Non-repetitive nucleoporin n=1 Tax=Patellaria atrata CBS 101060 TaxID=1346257 RepID=A0A9P4S6N6_9PEZI|nr:putative non-repetitive nucleoporin [Patellaria atrata CBS 101060]
MSSFPGPATPQRPLPGNFISTPAGTARPQPPAFPQYQLGQPASSQSSAPQQQPQQVSQQSNGISTSTTKSLTLVERAARTINETLAQDLRYPALDNYLSQGISSDYDIPKDSSWAPFQQVKRYPMPDSILEQHNQSQFSTQMGLFAELNHAWIVIDNALYLWDYTNPNPELVGFEEQPHQITAVRLVNPKEKVFVDAIKRVLIVSTSSDIYLVGLGIEEKAGGIRDLSLYQTRMQVSVKGMGVRCIAGSNKTGRIFFCGTTSNDVFELTYQQEEKWFANRCGKINHTTKGFTSVIPTVSFGQKPQTEYVVQMEVDDSRSLLYTLSNISTIRIFHMTTPTTLELVINKTLGAIKVNIGHMVSRSELIQRQEVKIVSMSPISASESQRLSLMLTTNTGCRIFMSSTARSYYPNDASSIPGSMQVHHVKFPPSEQNSAPSNQIVTYTNGQNINTESRALTLTVKSFRSAPGYSLLVVKRGQSQPTDTLFLVAPDAGRIARPQEPSLVPKFVDFGQWLPIKGASEEVPRGLPEDMGVVTKEFSAAPTPMGFGNDLATQFDQVSTEIAVLYSDGVETIRRRRLVDVFAATLRYGQHEEGVEGEVRTFIRRYGRSEITATALAVACGQGSDVNQEARVAKVSDVDVLENARKVFIEYGGKATINENLVMDSNVLSIDNVRPSPRHEGIALYMTRLLRSIWKSKIITEQSTPIGGLQIKPTVPLPKLQSVQRDLNDLKSFLDKNKSFIDGLSGPEALGRVTTKQDEIALQAEHRALISLLELLKCVIEGISFVLVLFDERVDTIVMSLNDTVRQRVREMTYENMFSGKEGKELTKELVKAIVNHNIANGANIDTVTDALKRRCGSFCSEQDTIIFKAQEMLKKATEAGPDSASGRRHLNDSLKTFEHVAESLPYEILAQTVDNYIAMSFFAGAIRLTLEVAKQSDKAKKALSWVKDGSPANDSRKEAFGKRTKCYDLVHKVIQAVDQATRDSPDTVDGHQTLAAKRKSESYTEINRSEDELFQTNLYDWYLEQGWSERLLELSSPYVVNYLEKKSVSDAGHADLLWRYFAHYQQFFEAAQVQLQLAKSGFDLDLGKRIEYLSRAKVNAGTRAPGVNDLSYSRQSRQEVSREISDLLELATIQEDILDRIKSDIRLFGEQKTKVLKQLDGPILAIDDLFNCFADQAGYHDICLLIYQIADHRNGADIKSTWTNLIEQAHAQAVGSSPSASSAKPWEVVADKVRTMGSRLNKSETTFPVPVLLPMLEAYAHISAPGQGPAHWVVEVFLDAGVAHETCFVVLENMFYNEEPPFHGRNKRPICNDLVYVAQKWLEESARTGQQPFGGMENAVAVNELLGLVLRDGGLDHQRREIATVLRARVDAMLRR